MIWIQPERLSNDGTVAYDAECYLKFIEPYILQIHITPDK